MISIIIPCYNRESSIEPAVRSVLDQTIKDIEVIVVDDCSTDNTISTLNSINDSRLAIVKLTQNKGACYARNIGIKMAKGEYIAFHDSDDIWLANKLEINLKCIKEMEVDVVFSAYMRIFSNGKEQKIPSYNLNLYENKTLQLLYDNAISTPTLFGKANVFKNIMFDESMPKFQDWEIGIRISQKYQIYYIDEVLMIAYVQENGITRNVEKSIVGLQKIYKKNSQLFNSNKLLLAKYYSLMGDFQSIAGISGKKSYKNSMLIKMDIKVLIKYILSIFNLYVYYQKIKFKFR